MADGRRNNKGTKGNKGGRPKGNKLLKAIEDQSRRFIYEILQDEYVKKEASKLFTKESETGYLYIIEANKKYKIGITSNFKNRFSSYKSHTGYNADVVYLVKIESPNNLERHLIDKFIEYNTNGDWFEFDSESILLVIKEATNFIHTQYGW
jgi:hypothetical protein